MILKAATRFFAVKGFKDTSMAEVSQSTGVASGTIFYHFNSKEELFLAILAAIRQTFADDFGHYFKQHEFVNGLEMVKGTARFYLHLAAEREHLFLLLHRHYPYELAEVNPVCREHLEAIHIGLVNIFETAIRKGQQDGSVIDIPPRKAALILYSMVDGVVRLNTYNLYEAGALYNDLIKALQRLLGN